ncbi:MAG: low specificity L-threonine aldolase [Treponema sp.]|nr:low specificity L-threonine aldolase [Treponema sp.]
MIRFECDYAEGCHPAILEALTASNFDQTPGYGLDPYCEEARSMIKNVCDAPQADIHFLVGGTQANATVISSLLRPFEGVLSAPTGHIACHETGAIEHSGHKVLPLDKDLIARHAEESCDADYQALNESKITASMVRWAMEEHLHNPVHEHVVKPAMVYLAHPSENGMLYTKKELSDIASACHMYGIPLYVDGARLGYGLVADGNDLSIKDLAKLADIFYIGGTKCGALFGEAIVITNSMLNRDFRYTIKMNGGMLAKGRLLGIQYKTLMSLTDEGCTLYEAICRSAVVQAYRIRDAFVAKGLKMACASRTNQQFVILTAEQQKVLGKQFAFEYWGPHDATHDVVRFCTSWATKKENVDVLLEAIAHL